MKLKSSSYLLFIVSCIAITAITQESGSHENGKDLFEHKCARCHGKDGTKRLFGAKNLQTSKMTEQELVNIISNGKKIMPSWKNKLTDRQIKLVVDYIKTLRK